MTCDEVRNRLDDFVDGALGPADARAVNEHLSACPSCRAVESACRRLVTAARVLPRDIEPAHDLWPAIERRIGSGAVREGRFGWWSGGVTAGLRLLAAAAVMVAVLGAVVGLLVLREMRQAPPVSGAADSAAVTLALAPASEVAADFARARAELRAALEVRRADLSPATLAVIDRNLAVIERAAAEIEAAMANDPGNQTLRGLLLAVYRQEIELLLRAAKLPAAS